MFKFKILLLLFIISSIAIPAFAQNSPDAIAIRVIPNSNNYSAMRWYKEQGFSGSPQSIMVDGYEAIRDGRTIYVNASNISKNGELYTNIYLISYNQEAEQETVEIVNQIISHWHFNSNIEEIGNCGISGNICLTDIDCELGEFCSSPKAKITRDTRRLSDLTEIKIALENYRQVNEKYPILDSGTYIQNNTISTWPSWNKTFAEDINIAIPVDPINKLGKCEMYNEITCWDEEKKEFADPNIADPEINFPDYSNAYIYTSKEEGNKYELCGVMESGLIDFYYCIEKINI